MGPVDLPPDPEPKRLRLMILGNGTKADVHDEARRLAEVLAGTPGIDLAGVDLSADSNLCDLPADVAIVLGGDGTVLHAAPNGRPAHTPPWASTWAGSASWPT